MTFFSSFCELSTHDICRMGQCECYCHQRDDRASIFQQKDEDALATISYQFWTQRAQEFSLEDISRTVDARWPHLVFRKEFVEIIREGASHSDWSLLRIYEGLNRYFPKQ